MNPKSIFVLIVFACVSLSTYSQVTVGSSEPPSPGVLMQMKQVDGVVNKDRNAFGGLGLPRVFLSDRNNLFPMFLNNPDLATSGPTQAYTLNKASLDSQLAGMIVYNTNSTAPFSEGIYVWTGQVWTGMGGVSGVNGLTTPAAGTLGLGGSLSANTTITTGGSYKLDFVNGTDSVRIGAAGTSSLLSVSSTNKGILIPRVTLTSRTDRTTVPNPEVGLIVYNTGKHSVYSVSGILYWNGSEWKMMDNSSAAQATLSSISCASATLTPSHYTSGVPYTGILRITYTDGNGGRYGQGPMHIDTYTGLVFRLQEGKLENGSGELVFSVMGTPTKSSPEAATMPVNSTMIPFYSGAACQAKVGDISSAIIKVKASVGPLVQTNEGAPGYHRVITTPDGKYSVRVYLRNGQKIEEADLQIRYNLPGQDIIMWSSVFAWFDDINGASNNSLVLSSGQWSGNNGDRGGNTEVQGSGNNVAWGNADVYYSGNPEHRSYMWTSKDMLSQTTYTLTFMMGAKTLGTINNSVASDAKAYLKIEEVLADR